MRTLTELIVRLADLVEAEGRSFRAAAVKLATGVGVLAIAAGAVLAGVAFVLAAIFLFARTHAGEAGAAAITGVVALGMGGLLGWLGRKIGT